jgi:hypothetical protein
MKPLHKQIFILDGIGYDTDALAFVNAAQISSSVQKIAVNNLVKNLKGSGLWSKMTTVYPFVGGSAVSHKFNLKDPRDVNAAYRLNFFGGVTHDQNGVSFNGTNGFADTNLVCSTALVLNDTHHSYYSRSNEAASGTKVELGANASATGQFRMSLRATSDLFQAYSYNSTFNAGNARATVSDTRGLFLQSRTGSANHFIQRNGSTLYTNTGNGGALPALSHFIGAWNNAGVPANYTTKQCGWCSIGAGLTSTEASSLYTIVQLFQTSLSRNV